MCYLSQSSDKTFSTLACTCDITILRENMFSHSLHHWKDIVWTVYVWGNGLTHVCDHVRTHVSECVVAHETFSTLACTLISQCERTCSESQEIEWLNASCTSERRRCVGSSCVRICSPTYENMFSYTLHLWEDIVWPFNAWERVLPHKNFVALTCVMWCDAMYILSPNVHTLKVCRHTPHEVKYG